MTQPSRAALLALAILTGCPPPATPPRPGPPPAPPLPTWTPVGGDALSATEAAQRDRAQAAAKELGGRLLGRLKEVIAKDGRPTAIAVCATEAPALALEVGHAAGLRLGRTSFFLRNPANVPPAWAEAAVAARAAEPRFARGPEGTLGALLPIKTAPECVACHGPPSAIADDVRAALAERYPDDRATGFTPGELRGYFWVEVPADAPSPPR